MDTRQNEREAAPTGGPQDRRSRASLGWGPGALAVVALVAVIAATIWAVASGDGSSVRQEVAPVPSTPPAVVGAGEEDAGRTIYLWDPNTGDVRVVHSAQGQLADAELSPDGESLVYERQASDGPSQIYLLGPDGIERRLTDPKSGASDPTWSPDGSQIAFASRPRKGSKPDIFVMDADGSHIRRLVGTAMNDGHPDWSPDGSSIAFHSLFNRGTHSMSSEPRSGLIWVASVRTRSLTQLTVPHRYWSDVDPAWSPDGRWIAYVRVPGSTINGHTPYTELWVTRPDGTHESRIVKKAWALLIQNPSWSPDGRSIVFEQTDWEGGSDRVRVVNPRTGRMRTILADADAGPSWSKEGILVSRPSGDPAPEPRPVPPGFQVEAPGIDATITLTGSSCELDIPGTIRPGRLKLELVDDSHLEGGFRVMRLSPTQTLSRLRAHPRGFLFRGDRTVFLDPSTALVWSSTGRIASGQSAVICYKDRILAPNGFMIVAVGVAGPIEVGR